MLRENRKNKKNKARQKAIPYTEKRIYDSCRIKSIKNTQGNTTTQEAIITTQTEPKQELKYSKTKTRVREKKERGVVTKYMGEETFYRRNPKTGDLEPFTLQMFQKEAKHTLKGGWRRVYLENFMEILTGLYSSGKKIEVVEFILNNLNSEHQFIYTQDYVAKKTGIAIVTVNHTFKYLVDSDFMTKEGTIYRITPDYINAYGSEEKNIIIGIKYRNARKEYEKQKQKQEQKRNKKQKGLFDEQGYYPAEAEDAESAKNEVS